MEVKNGQFADNVFRKSPTPEKRAWQWHHTPLISPVRPLNTLFYKKDVKSRTAGAGFPEINTGQASRRPTDSYNDFTMNLNSTFFLIFNVVTKL